MTRAQELAACVAYHRFRLAFYAWVAAGMRWTWPETVE